MAENEADSVVDGGCVFCNMGDKIIKLIGTRNTEQAGKIGLGESDTGADSFDGDFGICKTLTELNGKKDVTCTMSNIPIWVNTNSECLADGEPAVTMKSFTVCTVGGGVIVPLEDGQTIENFDYEKFANALPEDWKPLFMGLTYSSAYGNDPVNMATGNFIYSKDDIEIPGNFPIVLNRFYNAMGDSNGVIGKNWTHNYHIFLKEDGKNVGITFGDGHMELYYYLKDGSYLSLPTQPNTLVRSESGYDLILSPTMETYHFDHQGRLLATSDLNGNTTKLSYEGNLLSVVSNVCGSLHFTYNKDNQIIKVHDHAGHAVSYEYNGSFLKAATHPNGAVYRYEYGDNGIISDVIDPFGVSALHNEYDAQNRTVKQSFPDGGFAETEFDDRRLRVINTEQNGNQVMYVRDKDFRTTQIIYGDSEERFGFNKNNKRTLYVDRNGNSWSFEYDDRGNRIKETNPLGESVSTEFNAFNRPTMITGANGGIKSFEYDLNGNIIKSVDPVLRELQFENNSQGLVTRVTLPDQSHNQIEYDDRGNFLAVTDSHGNQTRYEYDQMNRVVKTIDAEGNTVLFAYNCKGNLAGVTDPQGNTRRYEYNLAGKISKVTDFDGGVIQYLYNALNKVEEIIDQAGGSTKFTYDLMWNMTGITDPSGYTVQYTYDQFQRRVQSIDQEGNITAYKHDAKGNVTEIISPNGARTEIEYDALDRKKSITDPNGGVTRFTYDKGGNCTAVTDALGNTTTQEFDLADRLVSITDALGNKTSIIYTPLGQIDQIANEEGTVRSYSYYPGGRLQSVTKACGEIETYEYNKTGNVVKITDGLGNETKIHYDSLLQISEMVNPLGHSKKFSYDAVGNITQFTDEMGHTTHYKYSSMGDIIEVIDATGHSTKYDYDQARRLSKVQQYRMIDDALAGIKVPEYQITTYEHNKKGEVIAINSPLGKAVRIQYDNMGNVISKVDQDGFETLYEYNLVGKVEKIIYADGKTAEFEYNALRQLTIMHDWLGITKFQRDALGRPTKITDFEGKEIGYSWNSLGMKEKLSYPDGSEVAYRYNASGRLQSVISEAGATNFFYDTMGRMKERVLPDHTITNYEINPLGQLSGLTHSKDGGVLDQFKYTYNPLGNITQIEKYRAGIEADSGVFQYTYDPLGRLVSAVRGEDVKRYRYDELGNRVKEWKGHKYDAVEWTQHSYNARNQLIKTQECGAVKEYGYDGRGNLTTITENGQLKSRFDFDATNMMVGAFTADKGSAEYTYNGFRNRVKKLESMRSAGAMQDMQPDPIREIRYVLDMTLPYDNLLMTEGSQNQSFVWGNGLLCTNGDERFHYLQDHLGSPIRLTGEDASDVLAYDEFGVVLSENGHNLNNPFGFTGYQSDDVSGLYYAQARYYEPSTSHMFSEDAYLGNIKMPSTLNLYAYCRNSPIALIDPSGYNWDDFWEEVKIHTRAAVQGIEKFARENLGIDTEKVGSFLLMMKPEPEGVYHAMINAWQQIGGFNDIYDMIFDAATSMNREKWPFELDGRKYIFWTWKGDYINLGPGGELGIYSDQSGFMGAFNITSPIDGHWLVDTSLSMKMTQLMKDRDGNIIAAYNPSDPQWWITSFNSNYAYQNYNADNLTSLYTVDMSKQKEMYNAFKDTYENYTVDLDNPTYWFFDDKNSMAILIYPMKVCAG